MNNRSSWTLCLAAPLLSAFLCSCESLRDFWNTPVSSSSSASKGASNEREPSWRDSQAGQQYTRDMYSVGNM